MTHHEPSRTEPRRAAATLPLHWYVRLKPQYLPLLRRTLGLDFYPLNLVFPPTYQFLFLADLG